MPRRFARLHTARNVDSAREQQQLFSQCGFACVGVRDDGKGAAAAGFVGVGHGQLTFVYRLGCARVRIFNDGLI